MHDTGPHILIAEDEAKIAELVADYLRAAGMRATIVADGALVLPAVAQLAPAALVLDLMLPNRDGLSICRELRQASTLPVIMVTARVEEIDRLLGLELGADDYLCKPFSPRELVARVKAVLRRSQGNAVSRASAPRFEVDEERMRAVVDGQRLDLTPVEFRLLATMARHPGRVYRRDELLDLVYDDYREVSDRTIDSHVKNLRRKIDQALPGQPVIHSVYGIGYRFEVD
ncbi:MAG: response regulator [Gammaproteobacteria bacterium]|nr:response regulator [Gammaproteobacteria bacterium]